MLFKVEGQWNGDKEMMLDIPNFPHLHSTIKGLDKSNRYPHPLEYFLSALCGTLTLCISNYSDNKGITIDNLYIIITCEVDKKLSTIKNLVIEIKQDSDLAPEELTQLQKKLLENEPIFKLLSKKDNIHINWD